MTDKKQVNKLDPDPIDSYHMEGEYSGVLGVPSRPFCTKYFKIDPETLKRVYLSDNFLWLTSYDSKRI